MSSEWIEWKGGDCPVPKYTPVDVKYRDGVVNIGVLALIEGNAASGGTHYRSAVSWNDYGMTSDADIVAWRLHEAEPSQLHERTFIPATREAFMAFFRSEAFDLLGLTRDNRKEIFLTVLQGGDDITENLLHELCSEYSTSLGDIPKYVPPPEPILSNNRKHEILLADGWSFLGVRSQPVKAKKVDADGTVHIVEARSFDEALEGAWVHYTLEHKQEIPDPLQYLQSRGWTFYWSVNDWQLSNKAKNLRVVRKTFKDAVTAALNYEVLSCT